MSNLPEDLNRVDHINQDEFNSLVEKVMNMNPTPEQLRRLEAIVKITSAVDAIGKTVRQSKIKR